MSRLPPPVAASQQKHEPDDHAVEAIYVQLSELHAEVVKMREEEGVRLSKQQQLEQNAQLRREHHKAKQGISQLAQLQRSVRNRANQRPAFVVGLGEQESSKVDSRSPSL